jgi:hypothetical protein
LGIYSTDTAVNGWLQAGDVNRQVEDEFNWLADRKK